MRRLDKPLDAFKTIHSIPRIAELTTAYDTWITSRYYSIQIE